MDRVLGIVIDQPDKDAAAVPFRPPGETPTLSPIAPASPSDLDKQHELGQFLTPASDTSPLIPLHRRLISPDIPHPVCDHPLPLPQARDIIRCGEGDIASLFEIHRSEVHLLDAGAGADNSRRSSLLVWPQPVS